VLDFEAVRPSFAKTPSKTLRLRERMRILALLWSHQLFFRRIFSSSSFVNSIDPNQYPRLHEPLNPPLKRSRVAKKALILLQNIYI
jgi:hypothetical protein